MWRSWEGRASPRAAAKPSVISVTENWRRARSYTCSGLDRRARQSIMLARATGRRQGLGRAWTKATSISSMRPSPTSRLAGLMSRWARPASQSLRMINRPSSITWVSTSASPSSVASAKNSVTSRYSRSGGELDEPERGRAGQPGSLHQRQGVVLLLDQAADGVERLLVLQPAVQELAAQLVPAVRAQMALGVQLAEQDRGRVAGDGDAQRRGAGRPGRGPRPRPGGRRCRPGS